MSKGKHSIIGDIFRIVTGFDSDRMKAMEAERQQRKAVADHERRERIQRENEWMLNVALKGTFLKWLFGKKK